RPFSHLEFAHQFWSVVVKPGDTVVDATAGNGHDALVLAKLALQGERGTLVAFDIQDQALENTQKRLANFPAERIFLYKKCHSKIAEVMAEVVAAQSAKLIVLNLGYLPGSDKSCTTLSDTTLKAIKTSLSLICVGGAISITCYPGHEEGRLEEQEIVSFFQTL